MNKKSLLIIALVIISGIFLAGCTDNTDEKLNEAENKLEVINSNADNKDEEDDVVIDTPDTTEEDEDTTEPDQTEEDADVEEDEDTTVVVEGSTYTGATTADNVRITKYNYYYEAGQLVFEWTFKSDNADKKIASYTTGYDSSNNFVITFGSVNKDYVATEEKDMPLGNLLPLLKVKPDGTKSEYRFMIEKKTDSKFEIKDDMLVLRLNLK